MSTTELPQILEDRRRAAEHYAEHGRLPDWAPPAPDFADERARQARQTFDARMGDISDLLEQADAIAVLITEAVTERHINSAAGAIITLLSNAHDALSAACKSSADLEAAIGQINAAGVRG